MNKLNKRIYIISILSLFLLNLVSASYNIYPGQDLVIPTEDEIVNCSVINSTYNLEGLNLSWNEKNILISTDINYQPDNLTISCWVIKYGKKVEQTYGGGGSCSTTWNCSEWSECINGQQTRNCSKITPYCNAPPKPTTSQLCNIKNETNTEEISTEENTNETPEKTKVLRIAILSATLLVLISLLGWIITKLIVLKKTKLNSKRR